MAETAPINPYLSYMSLQDPATAMRFQMQQALAQQMMAQGQSEQNPAQTVGSGTMERVVPMKAATGLADAGKTIAGAYMQKKNMERLAQMMSGKPDVGAATDSAIQQGGMGPVSPQQVGRQMMAQQPQNPLGGLPSVTGDPKRDMMLASLAPEYYKAMAARTQPTDLAKNVGDPHTLPFVQKDQLVSTAGGYAPASKIIDTFNGGGAPAPQPAISPPANDKLAPIAAPQPGDNAPLPPIGTPQRTEAIKAMASAMPGAIPTSQGAGGNTMPAGGAAAIFNEQATPAASPAPNVADMNNPALQEKLKAEGTAEGENIAGAEKSVVGIDSRINNAMRTLDEMATINPAKGHGIFGEYVGVPFSRNVTKGPEATAQTQFEQKNANLFTQELGPLLQSIQGTKGSIPLINAIKEASQIPEYGGEKETHAAIQGLKEQLRIYQENVHKGAEMTSGRPSPIPAAANPASAGVTHVFVPGKGIQPIGGQ